MQKKCPLPSSPSICVQKCLLPSSPSAGFQVAFLLVLDFFFFKTPMVNFLDSVDSFLVACWNFQKGYSCDLFASSSGGFKKFLSHWFNQSSQVFHVLSHPRAREREQRSCCRPWRSGVLEESLVSRQSVFVLPSELVVYSFWPRFLEATSG